jgi:hypothetical protein
LRKLPVAPTCRRRERLPHNPETLHVCRHPASAKRDVCAIVTKREAGCGGRGSCRRTSDHIRGRRSRVVLASRVFPELFQMQIVAQIRRAGLGLSSAVFSEHQESRRSDPTERRTAVSPL